MTKLKFFRSIFFITMVGLIGLVFVKCSDQNTDETQNQEFVITDLGEIMERSNGSVGRQHNEVLDKIFDHLRQVDGINRDNVREHVHNFFDTHYEQGLASLAKEYYDKYSNPNYNIYEDVSPVILAEIHHLENMLDNSDFADMQEFRNAVLGYVPTSVFTPEQQVMWNNYTDVFVHSFEYWEGNLDQWSDLLGQNPDYVVNCSGSWFKRLWCNTKKIVKADASAALGAALSGVSSGTAIAIISGVASAAAVI